MDLKKIVYLSENVDLTIPQFGLITNGSVFPGESLERLMNAEIDMGTLFRVI